jgi:hypothetical protein
MANVGKDKEEADDEDGGRAQDSQRPAAVSSSAVVSLESVRGGRDPGRRVVPIKDIIVGRAKVASREPERVKKRRRMQKLRDDEDDEDDDGDEEEEEEEEEQEEEEEEEEEGSDAEAQRRGEVERINAAEGLQRPAAAPRGKKGPVRQAGVKNTWSPYETDKFFDSVRVFGTDFTLAAEKFANRTRDQLVFKFHQEESNNEDAVTWAMRNSLEVPPELNPFELDLPCQLEGWSQEDLDKFYVVLLDEIKKRQQQ